MSDTIIDPEDLKDLSKTKYQTLFKKDLEKLYKKSGLKNYTLISDYKFPSGKEHLLLFVSSDDKEWTDALAIAQKKGKKSTEGKCLLKAEDSGDKQSYILGIKNASGDFNKSKVIDIINKEISSDDYKLIGVESDEMDEVVSPDMKGEKRSGFVVDPEKVLLFTDKYKDHRKLLDNIQEGMNETEVVTQLLENFFHRNDFNYIFKNRAPFTHSGDCGTLVEEFKEIAKECFGIDIQSDSDEKGYIISGSVPIIHKSPMTGNIDNGKQWYFEKHTWAVWKGKPIDVLFGQFGVVPHIAGVKMSHDSNEMPVYEAGKTKFYLKKGAKTDSERYTTNEAERMTGV